MDYFSVCLNGFCLAAQGAMHLFFAGSLTGKKQKAWHFALYIFFLGLLEWSANRINLPGIIAIGVELLLLYGVNRVALKNRRAASWIAAVLAVYVSQLSFGIVNSVEAALFSYAIGRQILYGLVILATAAAFALSAACYAAVLKFISLKESGPMSDTGLLLFPALFFFTAELYIMQTSYTYAEVTPVFSFAEAGKHTALMFLQVLGLGALLCTLYAYRRLCRGFEAQAAFASLAQAARAGKVYIAEAQTRYERTKAFRHDIKNHLSVLDGLLNSGKTDEGRAYLKKLETVSSALTFPYQTGHPVTDILLSEKLGLAKAKGIAAEVSLRLPSPCGIDDFDLCVIFANALDNAVCASQFSEGAGAIRVAGKRQGDFYMLEFTNPCPAGPLPPMGTGLSNIKMVAEKYHGAILMEKTGREFSLHVLLNISCPSESISVQKP